MPGRLPGHTPAFNAFLPSSGVPCAGVHLGHAEGENMEGNTKLFKFKAPFSVVTAGSNSRSDPAHAFVFLISARCG